MKLLSEEKRKKVIAFVTKELDSDYEVVMNVKWQEYMSREDYLIDCVETFDFFKDWIFLEYEENDSTYVCYLSEIKSSRGDDLTYIATFMVDKDYNILGYANKEVKEIIK
tara:strand:- start:51 stop:380 length:330 start_codon:yes stop_codon:yes gene_type:complete